MESLIDQIDQLDKMCRGVKESLIHAEQSGYIFTKEYALQAKQYNILCKTRDNLRKILKDVESLEKKKIARRCSDGLEEEYDLFFSIIPQNFILSREKEKKWEKKKSSV